MAQFHSLKIAEIVRETPDAISLCFAVPPDLALAFRYRQGQHLTIRAEVAGEELRRNYSICAGEDEGELRIAIKRVADGRFSAYAHRELKPGLALDVLPPLGSFHADLVPEAARTHLAFAAGSGITPILGIAATVLAREPNSRFILVYGNRDVASILFHERIEDLKNRYMARFAVHHVLSREVQDMAILNGRIDAAKVQAMAGRLFAPRAVDIAYICGPGGMIDEVSAALVAAGVAPDRILAERFSTDGLARPAAAMRRTEPREGLAEITVRLDGVTRGFAMPFDGSSIIERGNEQGLNLPFSCKGGMCSTCRARVTEGKVEMALNYALTPKEVAAGYVLTCQSHPATERVTLDYDV